MYVCMYVHTLGIGDNEGCARWCHHDMMHGERETWPERGFRVAGQIAS